MKLSKNSINFSIHLSDNDFQQSFGCPNRFLPSLVHRGFYEATGVCAELLGGSRKQIKECLPMASIGYWL